MATFYWDINDPPVLMFSKIKDLAQLAEAAGMPKTEAQIVNYGIAIVKRTNDFETAFMNWFNLPAVDQTYQRFKSHFSDAQHELCKIQGSKLHDTQFHQANQVSELQADFSKLKDELITSVNTLSAAQRQEQASDHESMNATTDINAAILTLLQQMQTQMMNQNSQGGGGGGATNDSPRRCTRRTTSKYCWSHGACAHESKDCKSPRRGHKRNATFENKMNGSTEFCQDCNNK